MTTSSEVHSRNRDDDANQTPQQKVLHLPELLERILLHLPFHYLFTCQRTCHLWHSTLTTSIPLRQRMYILPDSRPSTLEVCPAHHRLPKRRRKSWMVDIPDDREVTIVIDPPPAHLLPSNSSWWNLYLTQPPATRVWAFFRWTVEGAGIHRVCDYECRGELVNAEGFTMGRLLEAVLRDREGKVTVELYGGEEDFERGVAAEEVIVRLEREVGAKARFEGGRVWFLENEQGG